MRIKSLTNYYFITIKRAILIFYSFYMAGSLLGSLLTPLDNVTIGFAYTTVEGDVGTWSLSIIAFSIFMLITSLVVSQKDTRFLISRSVSRKEIFVSYALFMVPLSIIMSALQIISVYINGALQYVLGGGFRGLELDIQSLQAPDMKNILVFFIVSFSIMFCTGAISYLLGCLMARWKIQTVGALTILGMTLIALIAVPNYFSKFIDFLQYMLIDSKSGVFIAIKQICLAIIVMCTAFPIMRKVTAEKQ